jgi:hypothetical protein
MIKRRDKPDEDPGEGRGVPPNSRRGIDDIARRLDDLLQAMAEVPSPEAALGPVGDDLLQIARRKRIEGRERERVFGSTLFGDHGWEIMLELFIARAEKREVTIVSICRGISLPEAAVLRCIAILIEAQLVVRRAREADPRTILLTLTDRGLAMMCDYFNRLAAIQGDAAA